MERPEIPFHFFEAYRAWSILNLFRPTGLGLSAIPFICVVAYAWLIGMPKKYILYFVEQIGGIDVAYRVYHAEKDKSKRNR